MENPSQTPKAKKRSRPLVVALLAFLLLLVLIILALALLEPALAH